MKFHLNKVSTHKSPEKKKITIIQKKKIRKISNRPYKINQSKMVLLLQCKYKGKKRVNTHTRKLCHSSIANNQLFLNDHQRFFYQSSLSSKISKGMSQLQLNQLHLAIISVSECQVLQLKKLSQPVCITKCEK